MSLIQDQQNRISEVIKEILLRRIENFPEINAETRNAPFHAAILECFKERLRPLNVELPYLIAIASWMHGLNTSLGTGFENIAHILSGGYKRKFTGAYGLKIKKSQAESIDSIIRDLKAGVRIPSVSNENDLIFNYSNTETETNALDFIADTYFEKENEIIAIELKSVRPNSGEGRGEKQKILNAKAALKLQNPNKNIRFFVGFPFDPTSNTATGYDKERFFNYLIEFKKFFAQDEVLIAGELWDFLSSQQGTMDAILDVITETVLQVKK